MFLKSNKFFLLNIFYFKLELYSSLLFLNFSFFDNDFSNKLKIYFYNEGINICFFKNSLIKKVIINFFFLKLIDFIFKAFYFFWSFNLFFLINKYCGFSFKKNFLIKFGVFLNIYYNRYKLYYIFFLLNFNLKLKFNLFLKIFFKKFFLILKFLLTSKSKNEY